MVPIPLAQLRRFVVARQGYSARFRRGTEAEVEQTIGRLTAVQLDSIMTVDRSHRLTLGSRVGSYPRDTVSRLLATGRIFEYWAHEACLLPIDEFPLYRRTMNGGGHWRTHDHALREHAGRVEPVLEAIRERGPLGAKDFDGKGSGGMWNWKPDKMVLEALWDRGVLAIAGRNGFQRLYDLAERVIPKQVLEAPPPAEGELLRLLAVKAVEARGALPEPAIREHWRLKGGAALLRLHLDALVAEGRLRRVEVADGGAPVYVPPDAELDGAPGAPVLLSPFDNLIWDRPWTERLFGFRHVIEVYKREPERVYGYYVLPFLWRDRLVGRADLKSDRAEGVLRVKAFHVEPGVRRSQALDEALDRALARLARTIGLDTVQR